MLQGEACRCTVERRGKPGRDASSFQLKGAPPCAPEDRARMKETRTQREPSILFCLPSAVFRNSRPSSPKLPPWSFSMPHFSLLRGPEDKATPGEFNLTPPLLGLPSITHPTGYSITQLLDGDSQHKSLSPFPMEQCDAL
jgi:hypothetical protein